MTEEKVGETNFEDSNSTVLPIIRWLPTYNQSWLRYDIIAGFALAAGSIPLGMAYATLAGLPPQYGLYASIIAPLVYFFFATSRQAVVGPCLIQAILVTSVIGMIAVGDVARYLALASCTTIMVGILAIIAWKYNLGFLQNLISLPILKGFIAGIGILIIIHQIPVLMGIVGSPLDLPGRIFYTLQNAVSFNTYSIAIGVFTLLILVVIGYLYPRLPIAFIMLIATIFISSGMHLADLGVSIIGSIPAGLPALAIPFVTANDILLLVPLSFALFIVSYVELGTITRTYANKKKYAVDTTQELLAFGICNIATGFFQGFPISGNTFRSKDNYQMGAVTQMAGLVACCIIIIVLLFFSGFFYYLPISVLAAYIIASVIRIVDISGLNRIRMINTGEFTLALICCVGVLICGILIGVLICVILTLLSVLYQISYPHVPVLGRFPGTTLYGDVEREPEKEATPKILIIRIDVPFIFANTEIIYSRIYELLHQQIEPVILVIIDLQASPVIDATAVDVLLDIYYDLSTQGIALRIAEASKMVRDTLRRAGIENQIGTLKPDATVPVVIEEWRRDLNRQYSKDFYHTIPGDKRSIRPIRK